MTLLIIGILAFGSPHLLSLFFPAIRDRLMARFGEGAFKGIFSLISALGLIAMCAGYWLTRNDGAIFYVPIDGAHNVTITLATLGMILIAAGQGKSHMRLWLQNPFSIGIALWAFGHLLSVGKQAVVLFYLTMLAVALSDIVFSMMRGKRPDFQPNLRADITAIVSGLVVAILLATLLHPYVLGVNVLH